MYTLRGVLTQTTAHSGECTLREALAKQSAPQVSAYSGECTLRGSNRTRPAQTGFDQLNPDQTGSTGFDRLKLEQTG